MILIWAVRSVTGFGLKLQMLQLLNDLQEEINLIFLLVSPFGRLGLDNFGLMPDSEVDFADSFFMFF